MVSTQFFLVHFFSIFLSIYSNEQFHFGIINHHTQWRIHCPGNNTKLLNPPSDDQPLLSYECPYPSLGVEILPIEIDLTFLCRSQSRLIWIILDFYQYHPVFWLLNPQDIDIHIELNQKIIVDNSQHEMKNYTHRFILVHAFYIPLESLDQLLNEKIEINIRMKNVNQLNQCQFLLKDNSSWKTFIDHQCDSNEPSTLSIEHAQCDFYSNKSKSPDSNLQIPISDDISIATTNPDLPDMNLVLSIDELPSIIDEQTTSSIPSSHHHLSLEENYRQILSSLGRFSVHSKLLKLTILFLIVILIILVLFFLYVLCYHYHVRLRSATLIRDSSPSI